MNQTKSCSRIELINEMNVQLLRRLSRVCALFQALLSNVWNLSIARLAELWRNTSCLLINNGLKCVSIFEILHESAVYQTLFGWCCVAMNAHPLAKWVFHRKCKFSRRFNKFPKLLSIALTPSSFFNLFDFISVFHRTEMRRSDSAKLDSIAKLVIATHCNYFGSRLLNSSLFSKWIDMECARCVRSIFRQIVDNVLGTAFRLLLCACSDKLLLSFTAFHSCTLRENETAANEWKWI